MRRTAEAGTGDGGDEAAGMDRQAEEARSHSAGGPTTTGRIAMEWLDGIIGLLVGMTGMAVFGAIVLWTAPLTCDDERVCPGMGPECGVCGGEARYLANVSPPRCRDCEQDLGGE
jgi:hypothetical protein